MRKVLCAIALAIPVVVFAQAPADSVSPRAKQLHDRAIVVDSHDDTTQRLIFDKAFDIGKRNPNGNIDIPRMRGGGLDALFFSIWVPSEVTGPTAVKRALDQIDAVREAVRTHPHFRVRSGSGFWVLGSGSPRAARELKSCSAREINKDPRAYRTARRRQARRASVTQIEALAGIVLGYGGIATTDIQEGLRRLGKCFGQLEPGGTTTPL